MAKTTETGEIIPRNQPAAQADQPIAVPKAKGLLTMVTELRPEIARALPAHINADRMVRVFATALRTTPNLDKCTAVSFLGSAIQASQLGLETNTPLGMAYMIPFRNGRLSEKEGRDVYECQLVIGYQGMIELSMRTGRLSSIDADVVRDGDYFDFEAGLKPKLVHKPSEAADREQQKITHAYAIIRYKDGSSTFKVMSIAQIEAHRARSRAKNSGPWVTDYPAMCCKTVIRSAWKYMPKSPEVARAVAIEETLERVDVTSTAQALDQDTLDLLSQRGMVVEGDGV